MAQQPEKKKVTNAEYQIALKQLLYHEERVEYYKQITRAFNYSIDNDRVVKSDPEKKKPS